MALKFQKLTRNNIRNLKAGESLTEHGIRFDRLTTGDGRYAINIMVDGNRVHRVVGKESEGVTRQQAEEYMAKLRIDARYDRLNLPNGRKLALAFEKASALYIEKLKKENGKDIELKSKRIDLHLNHFFSGKPLSKITSSDIEKYKSHRISKGIKPATVNRELSVISHLLNKAVEWRWIEFVPCKIKRFKEENTRITYLTPEQIARILEVAKTDQNIHVYLFIVVGLSTSMRRSEILAIKFEHIDIDKKTIFIPKAKAGARVQPITKYLADFLSGHIYAARPDQIYLFESKRSECGHVVNIEKAFRRVIANAGLDPKEVVRHTLRHTAITHLVQAGVDLPTVQRISGHKTMQMVVRYSHQNGEHLQSAMDKLEERYQL